MPTSSSCPETCVADQLLGPVAVRGLDAEIPVRLRQRDRDEPRVGELAQPARDQREQARQLDLRQQAFPTSFSDSSWPQPARRRLVQAGVLDRDGRLGGEEGDELLVLLA